MTHRIRMAGWLILAAAVAAFLFLYVANFGDRISQVEAENNDLASQAEENAVAAAQLADQLRAIGEQPVVEPEEIRSSEPVPPTLTASEIRLAVLAYCEAGTCDGEDGEDASPQQVAAAIRAYCNDGRCEGRDGNDGRDGADSTVPGPPPSDQQVADGVAAYCATRNECRGPEGAPGPPGAPGANGTNGVDGKDGRGVTSVSCSTPQPFALTVTYSDGTSETYECGPADE